MFGRRPARPAADPTPAAAPPAAAPSAVPAFGAAEEEARRAQAALEFLRRSGASREEAPGSPVGREWRELKRRRRQRAARRTAAWLTALGVTVALAGGGWLGGRQGFAWLRGHTDLFRARSVEVSGVERLTRDEVVAAAGVAVGQDLIALRPDTLRAALARLPRVKGVTVDRTWRREIKLAVTERKPAALILLAETWEVDDEGVLLPADATGHLADLPVIVGLPPETAVAGARIDPPGLKPALLLAGRLAEAGLLDDVSDINVARPDSLVLVLQPDGVMVRAGDGDVPVRRLLALAAARRDLAAREIEPAYLDVRFSGLIVAKPIDPNDPVVEPPAPATDGLTAVLAAVTPDADAATLDPAAGDADARATLAPAGLRPPTAVPPPAPKAVAKPSAKPAGKATLQKKGKPTAGKPVLKKPAANRKNVKAKPTKPKTATGKPGKPAPKKPAQGQRRPHGQHT